MNRTRVSISFLQEYKLALPFATLSSSSLLFVSDLIITTLLKRFHTYLFPSRVSLTTSFSHCHSFMYPSFL